MNILIAEKLADAGVELFKRQPGWNTIVSSPKEYEKHLAEAEALVVRSAVQVTKDTLAKCPKLRVIGRAGVGVDNVDLEAATEAGVLVMNTPGGNAVSVAEHTLGLMLAMARRIPQATISTKSGKWEKKSLLGSELRGKTLGVIGLGSIGREVVRRARPFEMKIIAHDPYVTSQIARDLDLPLVSLSELFAQSDYITLHMSLTPETQNLLSKDAFDQMKTGVRIVNCARGELIDDVALKAAIEAGKVAGAALDAFAIEPPPAGFPLFELDPILATPHIGGSTEEAQEIVGVRIAEQMVEYLKNGVAINAVNVPPISPEQYRAIGPYITLAERLGKFAAFIAEGNPKTVRVIYSGRIAEANTTLIRNSALAGVLNRSSERRANMVNAMQFSSDRGWSVAERHENRGGARDSIAVELETDAGVALVEGSLVLDRPRLIRVGEIFIEAPLGDRVIFMTNHDVPGVIGHVGNVLGKNKINIANFSLGRQEVAKAGEPLNAVSVVTTDQEVPEAVLAQLLENPAITLAKTVEIS